MSDPTAIANDALPVLAETNTPSVEQSDGLLIERFILSLSVINLLNKQVKISTSGINGNSRFTDDDYKGHEVWLSVDVRLYTQVISRCRIQHLEVTWV